MEAPALDHGECAARIEQLETTVAQLQHALDSRIVIEQAKGAVSARCDVPPQEAFELLRGIARSQRRTLHEFCAEVIANGGRLDGVEPHRPVGLQT
jgi:AmiR/NasT family two-component response regulator